MDQSLANSKIRFYGFLLLLNCPERMQFGIDNQYWKIGPNFKGIKLIPPGAHYVYYALEDEEYASRMGFFILVNERQEPDKQDVIVRIWNQEQQQFDELNSQDEIAYQESVRNMDFDKYLGPYPSENYSQWIAMTNYINKEIIDKLDPINHIMLSEEKERELREEEDNNEEEESKQIPKLENSSEQPEETDDIDSTIKQLEMEVKKEEAKQKKAKNRLYKYKEAFTGAYYTTIPQKKVIQGLCGSALTEMNLDKTLILNELLDKEYKGNDKIILGEFQFAFITFLMGENLESYEQWKKMLILLCNCEKALLSNSELYFKFIPVLYEQLIQLPKDFFLEELTKVSFINDSLQNLIENTNEYSTVSKKLKQRVKKLKEMLVKEYDFKPRKTIEERLMDQLSLQEGADYQDDELPVIVDEHEQFISF